MCCWVCVGKCVGLVEQLDICDKCKHAPFDSPEGNTVGDWHEYLLSIIYSEQTPLLLRDAFIEHLNQLPDIRQHP